MDQTDSKKGKAVVTGGAGFIGSHLCDALLQRYEQVTVLDNLSSGKLENLAAGVELVRGDIRSASDLKSVIEGACSVFHLAAIASVEKCFQEFHASHEVNLGGLINVLDVMRTHGANANLVWASSAAVYGTPEQLPLTESSATLPLSSYGLDKLSGETYSALATKLYDQKVACMRLFNVVGPRQDPNSPYSGVVSLFANRMRKGEPIRIYGDGEQTRDFVSVYDVVEHMMAADRRMDAQKTATCAIYNVCTGERTSILKLFETLKTQIGYDQNPIFEDAKVGDIRDSLGDPRKSSSELGLSERRDLDQTLVDLLKSL